MRPPSLRLLKTFHLAAKHSSFKAAAEALCVTASAVSHQIRALESELGVALFERGPRSLALTPAGAHYFEQIDSLFSRLESTTAQLRRRFSRLIVRLQAPAFFAAELLVPRLAAFSAQHEDMDLQVATDLLPNEQYRPDADVSVIVGTGQWPNAKATRLFAQTYVPACSPALLRGASICSAADVAHETLIAHKLRPDLWDRWAAMSGIDELRPRQLIHFDTMTAAVHAAESGVGIALVSAPVAASRFMSGRLTRLFAEELTTGESYFLVTRIEDSDRPGARALSAWMLSEFGAPD